MIIPFPIDTTFSFPVGIQYVMIHMHFQQGDNSEIILKRFMKREDIPVYLEIMILSCVNEFLLEYVQAVLDDRDDKAVMDESAAKVNIQQLHKRYLATNKEWHLRHANNNKVDEVPKQIGFVEAYQELVMKKVGLNTLLQLEKSYAAAVVSLIQGKQSALENLHTRQSEEMEKMSQANEKTEKEKEEGVPNLVSKHVQEYEEMEQKWDNEIEGLKNHQRKEYKIFVQDYHASTNEYHIVESSSEDEELKEAAAKMEKEEHSKIEKEEHSRRPFFKFPSLKGSWIRSPETIPEKNHNEHTSELGSSPLRASSPVPSPLYNNEPIDTNFDENSSKAKSQVKNQFSIYLGRHRKTLFHFRVISRNILDYCRPRDFVRTDRKSQKLRTLIATTLYSNSLVALVILVEPDLTYKSSMGKEFLEASGATTDFHFDSIHVQLQKLKGVHLRTGDFFVTKHSNLSAIHVVFHLVIDINDPSMHPDVFGPTSPAALGLRNIVLTASSCDINKLIIPGALLEPNKEIMAPEGVTHRRAEVILRVIKAALTATGEGGALRTIYLVAAKDSSEQSLQNKYKSMLGTKTKAHSNKNF